MDTSALKAAHDPCMTVVIDMMRFERDRQIEKWGRDAFHYPLKPWLPILVEEVGEVAKELAPGGMPNYPALIKELVHTATVASFWAAELLREGNKSRKRAEERDGIRG